MYASNDLKNYLKNGFNNEIQRSYAQRILKLIMPQHSHSRTAVRNSRREVDMNVHVVLYLRACTYRYRCLISKICVFNTDPDFP